MKEIWLEFFKQIKFWEQPIWVFVEALKKPMNKWMNEWMNNQHFLISNKMCYTLCAPACPTIPCSRSKWKQYINMLNVRKTNIQTLERRYRRQFSVFTILVISYWIYCLYHWPYIGIYPLGALKRIYQTFGLQSDSQPKLNMHTLRWGRMNFVYMFTLNHTSNFFTRKKLFYLEPSLGPWIYFGC